MLFRKIKIGRFNKKEMSRRRETTTMKTVTTRFIVEISPSCLIKQDSYEP